MKPLQHAQITAHRYGGDWPDWYRFHDWFDQSKKAFPSVQHRMFLHSDYGCAMAVRIFGDTISAADGTTLSTQELSYDHQIEDLGRVVTLTEWLDEMDDTALVQAERQALRRQSKADQELASAPATVLAHRYGTDTQELTPLVAFFDELEKLTQSHSRSRWVLHNSFGIYLAEELLGPVLTLSNGRLVSVRGVGEELVKARLGYIPSAAAVASRIRMRGWMSGSRVGNGLRTRKAGPVQARS